MKKIFFCRRSSLALIGIIVLAALGYLTKDAMAVATGIMTIVLGIAGSNAYQKSQAAKYSQSNEGNKG